MESKKSIFNEKQLKAVESKSSQLVILAGPGSGKTRVISYRVAHLIQTIGILPGSVVVVTFTNKAAEELRDRISKLVGDETAKLIEMGTFHSVCASYLRKHGSFLGISNNFGIADDEDSKTILKKVLKRHPQSDSKDLALYRSYISKAKAQFMSPDQFKTTDVIVSEKTLRMAVAAIYMDYQVFLEENDLLDFDDILVFGSTIEHILVDEFQDTNKIQYMLIQAISKHSQCITIVGDPDQSIYSWRSAEVGNIDYFQKDYVDTEVVFLEQNYRSSKSIIETSLKVIRQDKKRIDKGLWTENNDGLPVQLRYFSQQTFHEQGRFITKQIAHLIEKSNGMLTYNDFAVLYRMNRDSTTVEQEFGLGKIPYRVIGGTRFFERKEVKDILCYIRLALNPSDNVAFTRIINVPPRGIGEVSVNKLLEAALKLDMPIFQYLDHVAKKKVKAPSGIGSKKLDAFYEVVASTLESLRKGVSISSVMLQIIHRIQYSDYIMKAYPKDSEERLENLKQLRSYADIFESKDRISSADIVESKIENSEKIKIKQEDVEEDMMTQIHSSESDVLILSFVPKNEIEQPIDRVEYARKFIQDINMFNEPADKKEKKRDAVTLMTLHSSKGLEYAVVFIIYAQDGCIPMFNAKTDEQIAEERRLLFVGMTRAKALLFLSCEPRNSFYGVDDGGWSQFLTPLASRHTLSLHDLQQIQPRFTFHTPKEAKNILRLKVGDWETIAKIIGREYQAIKSDKEDEKLIEAVVQNGRSEISAFGFVKASDIANKRGNQAAMILVGLRLQNCYDISAKVYLLKFAKPDVKKVLLVESGIRLHLTEYSRDKGGLPGSFCMKLRKHLRTKRLAAIRQLGVDRIVDMEFGFGESAYHLICEFYASGNIILTDHSYTIISLLRVVSPDESVRFAVGEEYPFRLAKNFEPLTQERISNILENASPKDAIKKAFGFKLDYSQPVVEHLLLTAGIEPSKKVSAMKGEENCLFEALKKGDDLLKEISTIARKGFIFLDKDENYQEFHSLMLQQFQKTPKKEFNTFNSAVDNYFSSIETQKQQSKAKAHESAAIKKLENVRSEHASRVSGLEKSQLTSERKARLIQQNLDFVDQAILIIRSALATGMDWNALKQLLEEEKIKENPVALLIEGLKLETNQITLLLKEADYEKEYGFEMDSDEDDNEGSGNLEKVDVEIGLGAFANAQKHFETKKQTAKKHEKTIQASVKALKSAETKIKKEMEETKVVVSITKARKPYWFEKFLWFVSSENYLVIGGRDAQQNELLVKKYLKKGDVYIHADIAGSSSVIVKCNDPTKDIPALTLSQAGTMAIVYSRAWDAKVVTSAYWVKHDQVSKTAPSGEFLGTGSFMIRGKKNYLPPAQLIFGFGLLFKVADECIPKHFHERRPELRGQDLDDNINITPPEIQIPTLVDHDVSDNENEEASLDADNSADVETTEAQEIMDISEIQRKLQQIMKNSDESERSYSSDDDELNESATKLDDENQDSTGRKYVSAKERRDLKKNTTSNENFVQPVSKKKEKEISQPQQKLPRGKKGKMKKMKEKYGDQDEEDRKLRLSILASAGKPEKVSATKEEKQYKSDVVIPRSMAEIAMDKDLQVEENLIEQQLEDENEEDKDEIKRLLEEENIQGLDQEETDDINQLDALTGCPLEDDILLHAVPVCAPYTTLQSYKYKLKLLPGSMKKGKAAKAAQHSFAERKDATPIEKELIKSIPEPELIQSILGKVKIMAPGMEQTTGKFTKKKKTFKK